MQVRQLCNGYRIIISLMMASLFGFLAYATLLAVPVAATDKYPNMESAERPTLPIFAMSTFTVTGVITNQIGAPLGGVQVFAFSGVTQVETMTNISGHFTLTLNVGHSYDIVLNPPPATGLASRFFGGINDTQDLGSVILVAGHSISGTVYRDMTKTNPVPNVAIFAFNKNTFEGFGLPPTNMSGAYQISLEESIWELTFTPPPNVGLGPTQTVITLTQAISKDIVLPSGFTVTGTVTAGGNGQPNVEIFAQNPITPGFGFSPTGPSGHYTGTLPDGNYDILFFAPPFSGFGSTVVTNVVGPPDIELNVILPPGHTVSGTVRCGSGLANVFVDAAPQSPLSAGRIGSWGQFAGLDGFYALTLQSGTYTLTIVPPDGNPLPKRIVPTVAVTQDMTLNFDYNCRFLPLIFK